MLTLDPGRFAGLAIPIGTGWLLGACMEARGKQDLWIRQKPEVLEVLREQAIIQSVESSNRIEGVTVAPDRLRPLVLEDARPRDRSEEEIQGYRRALEHIAPDQLVISSDCGFGRQGCNREIAFYKAAAIAQGCNIVRQELGLATTRVPAADPMLQIDVVPGRDQK